MRERLRRAWTAASSFSETGVSVSGSSSASFERRRGALRLRLEFADGFDFVAEEIDTHGAVHLRRVDVEDAAAAGELAGHLDDVHLGVADGAKVVEEHLDIHLFAASQLLREAGVVGRVEEAHAGGLDRRDDDRRAVGRDLPQDRCALFLHIGVRRDAFEGQDIVRGQAQDALRFDGTGQVGGGAQRQFERFGGLVVGDENDDGGLGGVREERNAEGARGGGQPGDTTTPSREAEMPSHTLETIGVLNAREGIANKGKDHAL